ncbi:hypothetical protein TVAG_323790 [Trichomonas vaginalis G3]|uniref:Uncharacterized protein n=1 Tax=Trichomonas vaginalis (strain ATCC PRA-98 / G3) TaxID=412133 RepID=A2F481_TRIV3|nr:hypothetical protein TVAGG3_1028530 [Trichomonas vaginalis G3]EAY00260.1 hypothetical protein TVAG_323790 [Trichomonas vaginalis G3]KAI5492682.1 hypothetical protein TVAGG3_1028530 [Trichomonas vaginalis G3]|eukprot:XP_001313189.1 hypothetical protein [Trichomonas vaginalis G3]
MTKSYNVGKYFQSEIQQQPTLIDIYPDYDQKSNKIPINLTQKSQNAQQSQENQTKTDKIRITDTNTSSSTLSAVKEEKNNNKIKEKEVQKESITKNPTNPTKEVKPTPNKKRKSIIKVTSLYDASEDDDIEKVPSGHNETKEIHNVSHENNKNEENNTSNPKKSESQKEQSSNISKKQSAKRKALIADKIQLNLPKNHSDQIPFSIESPKVQSDSVSLPITHGSSSSDEEIEEKQTNLETNQNEEKIIEEIPVRSSDSDSDSGYMFDPKKVCRMYEFPSGKNKKAEVQENQSQKSPSSDKNSQGQPQNAEEEEDFNDTSSMRSLKTEFLQKSQGKDESNYDYEEEYDDSSNLANSQSPKVTLIMPDSQSINSSEST